MEIKLQDLLKDINNGKLKNVLIILGDEFYITKVILDKIKEKFDISVIWGDETSLEDIINTATETSMFSEAKGKVTIIRYTDKLLKKLRKKEVEKFISLLKRLKDNYLVLVYESSVNKQDINKEPLRTLLSNFTFVKAQKHSRQRIADIIRRKFIREGKTIDDSTIELLIEICGTDLMFLKQETDKLLLYANEKKEISKEDVIKVCSPYGTYTVFDFIDSVLLKDFQNALKILKFFNISGIILLQVLAMLSNTVMKIYILHKLVKEGKSIEKAFSVLGITNKFQQIKYKSYVNSLSEEEAKKLIELLYLSDRRIKVNYEDPLQVLEDIIYSLLIKNINNSISSKSS